MRALQTVALSQAQEEEITVPCPALGADLWPRADVVEVGGED